MRGVFDPVTLAVLVPFATALACACAWRRARLQRALGVGGAVALLGVAVWLLVAVCAEGHLVTRFGNWPAPFGIVLVADFTSALMVLVTAIIAVATAIYSLEDIPLEREGYGYSIFLHFMLAGVCGAFLTGDIFNMFVWFEVMLISSFALMCLGGERAQMEGAVKYVTLNLVSSSLFLAACGILYAKVGTLNLADLAVRLGDLGEPDLLNATSMLFLVAFGLKAGVFPLFFWLPASYHTPPVAVSAVFAGLLTKVGVYSLIRMFTLVFPLNLGVAQPVLLAVAVATMVTGVLGAVVQYDFRRLLSFHIISQIGYMVLGLALFSPLALAGAIFYIFHHILVKSNLFFASGIARRLGGTFDLKKLGGLLAASPLLAVLFFIPAMSLGGIPPLSGFFAKFAVVKAALAGGTGMGAWAGVAAAAALAVGLLTLFSMTKIWAEAFWKKAPEPAQPSPHHQHLGWMVAPAVGMALATIVLGVAIEPFYSLMERAAEQLLNPAEYIAALQSASLALR